MAFMDHKASSRLRGYVAIMAQVHFLKHMQVDLTEDIQFNVIELTL